jgi:hypothetical protein
MAGSNTVLLSRLLQRVQSSNYVRSTVMAWVDQLALAEGDALVAWEQAAGFGLRQGTLPFCDCAPNPDLSCCPTRETATVPWRTLRERFKVQHGSHERIRWSRKRLMGGDVKSASCIGDASTRFVRIPGLPSNARDAGLAVFRSANSIHFRLDSQASQRLVAQGALAAPVP